MGDQSKATQFNSKNPAISSITGKERENIYKRNRKTHLICR